MASEKMNTDNMSRFLVQVSETHNAATLQAETGLANLWSLISQLISEGELKDFHGPGAIHIECARFYNGFA
jgi:hypothetical protein